MKTIKEILLTIAVLLFSLTAKSYDFEVDGIRYDVISFTELTVKASSVSESITGDLIIPSKVQFNEKELNVIEVGEEFAISNLEISSLTISDGVKSVGDKAFKNCSNLIIIEIAQTITSIGIECFYGCCALEEFDNAGIVTLGAKSFAECSNLNYVSIENLVSLKEETFLNCIKLTDCYLPSITTIGKKSFVNCISMNNYIIPSNVNTIGDYAFAGCSSLSSIIIPNNVTELGKGIFNNCTSLASVTIGSGISYLPWIFDGCTGLSDIRIEDSYQTLTFGYTGEHSYSTNYDGGYVNEYESYYYPYSSMFIDKELKNVYIGRNIETQAYLFKEYYQGGAYMIENYYYKPNPPFSGSDISTLTIGPLVSNFSSPIETSVYDGIFAHGTWNGDFQNCTNLDSVIIYSSATLIPKNTFNGCDKISTIEIPNSVKKIAANAFEGCTGLKILSLGSGLETIESNAFAGCDSLMEINLKAPIPPTYNTGFSSANYINTNVNVPANCLNIYQETVPWKNFWNLSGRNDLISVFEIDGIKYSEVRDKNIEIIDNSISELTELYINNMVEYYGNTYNVVSISEDAFKNCSYLSSIQMEDGIEYIGESAFENCEKLETINLPSSLQEIGSYAFAKCSLLDNVILPNSITTIPSYCFYECESLSSMVIPSSVIEFEQGVFLGCTGLKELVFEDGNEPLIFPNGEYDMSTNMQSTVVDGVTVKFKIEYYNSYFADLPIEKLSIGRNISNESRYTIKIDKAWNGWDGYYYNYYLITSYDAPFSKLPSLKELIIGENVDVLGPEQELIPEVNLYITPGSFKNCPSIQTVEVNNATPPTGAEFTDAIYSTANLKVPINSIEQYNEAIGWKDFANIMKFNITYIVDNNVYLTETLSYGDVIVLPETPTKEGYTFSGWSEIPETMPAEDITIAGSFIPNIYAVNYVVDGEYYATDSVACGNNIILIDEPVMEGHTFAGWSEVPNIMPANDIIVEGAFEYYLTYIVDGEIYAIDNFAYGSEIVPEEEPVKEGYTFSGWSEIPETMPSHDVEVTGSFIPTNVSEIIAEVFLQVNGNNISLSNANNSTVAIYSINGVLVKRIDKYTGEEITLDKGIYIVCVGDKAMKIIL